MAAVPLQVVPPRQASRMSTHSAIRRNPIGSLFGMSLLLLAAPYGQAHAEDLTLICQYTFQKGGGVNGNIQDKPWTLEISGNRIDDPTGSYDNQKGDGSFTEIGPKYIRWGITGSIQADHTVDRETGEIVTHSGLAVLITGLCQKSELHQKF